MTSYIDKVSNGLQKLKSLGEGADTLPQREQLLTQIRIDLTCFEHLPPTNPVCIKECALAREVYEYAIFLALEKEDIEAVSVPCADPCVQEGCHVKDDDMEHFEGISATENEDNEGVSVTCIDPCSPEGSHGKCDDIEYS